jgi:peptide deformylase
MTARPILRWPDPRLSLPCAPVGDVDAEIETLAADMLDTMYAAQGRGLAAPQVGVLKRFFVMDVTWKEAEPTPMVLIDPEIVSTTGEPEAGEEMCLSIPGVVTLVTRPPRIALHWTALDGNRRSAIFEGAAARCAQHEMDHLDGIVTFDRLEPEARRVAETAYAG